VWMKLRCVRASCLWGTFQNQNLSFHSHSAFWNNFMAFRDQKSCLAVHVLMHGKKVDGTSWISWYYISYEDVTLKHASTVRSECSTSNCLLPKHHFNYFLLMHHLNSLLLKHHLFSSNVPHRLLACNFITSNYLLLMNHLNCLLLMHHFQLFASNASHQSFACNVITSKRLLLMNHLNCLLLMHHFRLFASNAAHQSFACNVITSKWTT